MHVDSEPAIVAASSAAIVYQGDRAKGAGYFICPNLLLTTQYPFLRGGETPGINAEGICVETFEGQKFRDCKIIWPNEKVTNPKVAVIQVPGDGDGVRRHASFARFVGSGERTCEATAFVPMRPMDDLVARRITGVADPAAYPGSKDILEFRMGRLPEFFRSYGGAGVCFQGHLVGIITEADVSENTFLVTPVAKILENAALRACLIREFEYEPDLIDLSPSEATIIAALKDVSKADPSNIQEVAAAQLLLNNLYYENALAQAKRSFNAAVVAATVGLAFFLAAVVFAVLTGSLTAPLISALGGGVVEVVAGLNFWLYGRTAVQLNSFHQRLERMQRYLVANSVAASLTGENKETALVDLVKTISTRADVQK